MIINIINNTNIAELLFVLLNDDSAVTCRKIIKRSLA